MRLKFRTFLVSNDLRFGFKSKHSTNHAVFTLKSCVNYFTQRGSNVFVAFLDFSKAFDTISHGGLLTKLMNRKVPLCFLLLIMFWYSRSWRANASSAFLRSEDFSPNLLMQDTSKATACASRGKSAEEGFRWEDGGLKFSTDGRTDGCAAKAEEIGSKW